MEPVPKSPFAGSIPEGPDAEQRLGGLHRGMGARAAVLSPALFSLQLTNKP